MLSFNISYWDLVKFHYFADTTEREEIVDEGEGEDRVTLRITLLGSWFFFFFWLIMKKKLSFS
jgi:hypothetical protein